MQKDTLLQSLYRAAATFVYVVLVVSVLSNAEWIFKGEEDEFLIPIFMLLLFLISATITSVLVLGKPITLYQAGDRKGAVTFLVATVGWLAVFLVAVGVILAVR